MSVNINIRDKVYAAIEEFNNLMLRNKFHSLSLNERKGMFYTCLRRNIDVCFKGPRIRGIRVDDLGCQFRENGTLKSLRVDKSFNHLDGWDTFYDTSVNIRQIQHLSKGRQEFYRTPIMNEIADIVNSIK